MAIQIQALIPAISRRHRMTISCDHTFLDQEWLVVTIYICDAHHRLWYLRVAAMKLNEAWKWRTNDKWVAPCSMAHVSILGVQLRIANVCVLIRYLFCICINHVNIAYLIIEYVCPSGDTYWAIYVGLFAYYYIQKRLVWFFCSKPPISATNDK